MRRIQFVAARCKGGSFASLLEEELGELVLQPVPASPSNTAVALASREVKASASQRVRGCDHIHPHVGPTDADQQVLWRVNHGKLKGGSPREELACMMRHLVACMPEWYPRARIYANLADPIRLARLGHLEPLLAVRLTHVVRLLARVLHPI